LHALGIRGSEPFGGNSPGDPAQPVFARRLIPNTAKVANTEAHVDQAIAVLQDAEATSIGAPKEIFRLTWLAH
jgi:hypothetical protein